MIKNAEIGKDTRIPNPDLVNIYNCTIGEDCSIATFVEIQNGAIIGDRCKIQAFVLIAGGTIIGNEVFIGQHVAFTNDKYPKAIGDWILSPTIVKDGVSIGAGAIILPGIVIGENAIIGAGAVVTKDIPANTRVMGIPAR